jgi:tetratricopeptide (TPR) repeat protein
LQAYFEKAGMNAENFSDFIQYPANLYRINYQELKGLVLQYPNALNLRILLLLKSKIENHPDFEKNLRAASLYAVDRSRLYDLLQNPALQLHHHENVGIEGETITVDLSPSTSLKEEISTTPVNTPVSEPDKTQDFSWLEQPVENLEAISATTLDSTTSEVEEVKSAPARKSSDGLPIDIFEKYLAHLGHFYSGLLANDKKDTRTVVPESEEIEMEEVQSRRPEQMKNLQKLQKHKGLEEQEKQPITQKEETKKDKKTSGTAPLPKESFSSWQEAEENFEIEFDALEQIVFDAVKEEEENKQAKKKEKSEAELLAKKSLKLRTGIVSETLAELLVKQENYEQAIEMYEQLILKYPEKSAFFALQIENLKNL